MKVRAVILELAARPDGVTIEEAMAEGMSRRQWEQASWALSTSMRVVRMQVGPRMMRYFTRQEDCDRFALNRPVEPPPAVVKPKAPPRPHQKPCVAAPVTIKPTGRGPAYLPGDPVPTSRTIYTYGRSPSNPTRTNTHSEAA